MKFLIDFKADTSDADISAYLQQHGCTILKEWIKFDKIFLVEAGQMPPETSIIDRVVEENHLAIQPLEVIMTDSYYGTHNDPSKETITIDVVDTKDWWKNFSRREPEFTNPTTTIKRLGKNINVYIMDSGIEASHPEFANASITNIYTVTPGDFNDNAGHGTGIASVIAGATCGITEANLKIVKIFDPSHTTTEHEFLDALDAIINDHVDNTYSVLNASWSIPKNEWVEHKLRILEDEGVFIVAAAGNSGVSIEDVTPASMIDVITVGAYNKDLKPCNFSDYTGGSMISVTGDAVNHGELDGWAPGEEIWVAGLNGTYGYVAGTSIAAGIASAVLASNITYQVYEDGQRFEGYENDAVSTAVIGSNYVLFGKPNILDLTDPKYENSVNLIASLKDRAMKTAKQAPDEHIVSYRVGTGLQGIRIFEPTITKSIEWIAPLPNNFTLLPDGRIYGKPDTSQGPGPNEAYKTYVSTLNRTSIDNTQETVTVNIFVLPENFAPESVPQDDPVHITLLFNCSGVGQQDCYESSPSPCNDFCAGTGGICCTQYNSKGFVYQCVCQA